MKIAVAYIRVSTDLQKNGPEAQRLALERYASQHDIKIVEWCEDIGISGGAALDERPGLMDAIAKIQEHEADHLLVSKRDRLARQLLKALMIEELVKTNKATVVSADGISNDDSPEAEMMRGMMDLFAQYERAIIRARTKAAMAAKKRRGEFTGGETPYGYRLGPGKILEPNEDELAVMARIRSARADGRSFDRIADGLNQAGVKARGKRWHASGVRRILTSASR